MENRDTLFSKRKKKDFLNILLQGGTATSYAAGLARAYSGGGYTDWYLPSKDELNKLYLNKVIIGGFADELYWSSSEDSAGYAWLQWLGSGGGQGVGSKGNGQRVRAVRAF